jgi:hypothetical protein
MAELLKNNYSKRVWKMQELTLEETNSKIQYLITNNNGDSRRSAYILEAKKTKKKKIKKLKN